MRLRERSASLSSARVRAVALLAMACAACGSRDPGAGFAVTDSAGVAIVENSEAAWGGSRAWRIGDEPLLDLGGDETGPDGIFERVAGVILLPDGGVIAGDEGASEVRAFDSTGGLRWRAGRRGDGPAEFRLLASLGPGPADSIWAFDFGNRRITVLDASGTPVRTFMIGASVSAPSVVGWLDDGTVIVREMWGSPQGGGTEATGLSRDPAAILALDRDGSRLDTVAVYPGREVWLTVEDGRGVMSEPLLARNTAVAASGGRVLVGDQAAFVIDVLSVTGTKQRSVRLAGLDLAVSDDVIGRTVDALLERLPRAERQARRTFLETLPGPSSRPAFGRILVAQTGEIWVSQHATPLLDPPAWYIFNAEGRWLGSVAVPERFRLESIGADRVAGVWRDEYDVEHVRTYALDRDSG